jgi:hypothetical protein
VQIGDKIKKKDQIGCKKLGSTGKYFRGRLEGSMCKYGPKSGKSGMSEEKRSICAQASGNENRFEENDDKYGQQSGNQGRL